MYLFQQKRMVKTFYLLLILFVPIVARLIDVQIAHGPEYARRALEQRSVKVVLEDIQRGDILDRNLKSLTGVGLQERVVVFPAMMDDPFGTAQTLAGIVGADSAEIMKHFSQGSGILPYQLNLDQINKIKAAACTGVMVLPVEYRYHRQPLAVHLIGHLGSITSKEMLAKLTAQAQKQYTLNDLVGKMGLEKYYEQYLKAAEPERQVMAVKDAAGNLLEGIGFKVEVNKPDSGRCDVVTTIDYRVQKIVEQVMDEKIKSGAVVVMDVRSGDIVAMASRPNFHPAKVSELLTNASTDTFIDHCTALYQPGSIFKIVVAAAALEEGLVTSQSTFVCLGEKADLVSCWHKEGHGPITFEQAFAQSCNPVFAELALKLGPEKIIEYARRLGLDNQTVIGYPFTPDSRQNLNKIAEKYNLVNSSIGQGPVLASPVQLTAMLNTLVNNGTYIPPRLVRELRTADGRVVKRFAPGSSYKAISAATAAQLRELLSLAVREGVAQKAMVENYGSAGKTGSAELPGQQEVNAWFSGYAPLNNPRYAVTVLAEQGISGGESAAPVFKEIIEQTLSLPALTR